MRVHDGVVETILEDGNAEHTARVEQAFAEGRMSAPDLGAIPGTMLQQLTSVAFGGADGRTVYLGSLHADCVYRFRADVRGAQ